MSDYLWLFYALLSALAAALVSVFAKIGLQGIDPNAATVIRALIMAAFLVLIMCLQQNFSEVLNIFSHKKALLFIILSGIAGASSWLFYFLALKYGKVAQVASVDKFSVVLATLIALIFLGETISWVAGLGVGFITLGILLVALG